MSRRRFSRPYQTNCSKTVASHFLRSRFSKTTHSRHRTQKSNRTFLGLRKFSLISSQNLATARIHPDSGLKPVQIVALYFYCEPVTRKKPKPKGDLVKLKWVRPTKVFKYFTTSTCDEVTKFLVTIEKAGA